MSILRAQQLLREDVRDLTQIHQIDQLEILARILTDRSALPLVYSNMAGEIQVSVDTVRRWIEVLSGLHLGFRLRPWFRRLALPA